jgi:hypothetical protein
MPISTTTYSTSFVDAQRELYRHGLLCVPRTSKLVPYERWKRLWDEDSCAFLVVPVSNGGRQPTDSRPALLTSSVTIRHALRVANEHCPAPSEGFNEQEFRAALSEAYPGEDFFSQPRKASAELREIPRFANYETALSY